MRSITKILFALIIAWLLIEFLSFGILSISDLIKGGSLNKTINNRINDISLALNSEPISFGSYDPIVQFWPQANSKNEDLKYNQYGFIDNENSNISENFPNKINKEFRVILMGGSSAIGISGTTKFIDPKNTIASILERKLNSSNIKINNESREFTVLNFAQIGGWSSNNYIRYTQYLKYLNPNMVIYYNGFNDGLMGENQGDPYINWYEITKFNLISNLIDSKRTSSKLQRKIFFPYTIPLVNKFFFKNSTEKNQLVEEAKIFREYDKKTPIPKIITGYIKKNNKNNKSLYFHNTNMMAVIAEDEKVFFIHFLQPNSSWDDRNKLVQNDKIRKINPIIMKKYIEEIKYLERKFNNSKYVKILDKSNIFKESGLKSNEYYQPDGFHLTELGNEIIANEFFKEISFILK